MNKELFNQWADSYDESIKESERSKTYPFYGYGQIQEYIYKTVTKQQEVNILEMGIGTGMMTKRLYDEGYNITGVDFSVNMLEKAKEIMPNNDYIHNDFLNVIQDLNNKQFDVIIFSYSIHHLDYSSQVKLLCKLSENLTSSGIIIIGDVMTSTMKDMKQLALENKNIWDDEEFYPSKEVYSISPIEDIYSLNYKQLTYCSGVIHFAKL